MTQRRSFLSAIGLGFLASPATLPAQSAAKPFQPARHSEDDWLDAIPGKHRMVCDTTTPDGMGSALLFGNNFLDTNRNAYRLEYSDVAMVIVLRHNSTPFAFNDAMWAKYGSVFASRLKFNDPRTQQPPDKNLYNTAGYSMLPSFGITIDSMLKRGVHLAVCRLATRNFAGAIASATGSQADKVNEELTANTLSNSHMVPAGIVALSRAQERGYTFTQGV